MYRIICPTDFSEVSKNALLYAISLLNDLGGHLHIAHFYDVPHASGHDKMMDDMIEQGAEEEMEVLVKVSSQWLASRTTMDYVIRRGDCAEQLNLMAHKDKFNLIVMGSQGPKNKMKLIFGSTAKAVINQVDVPTIIIPPDISYRPIHKIVVATDEVISESGLELITDFGRSMLDHLYILHIGEINIGKEEINYYGNFLTSFSYSFHNIEGDDVLNGINVFTEEVGADLLVMTKRKRKFFQKIFGISHTDLELFQAQLPFMIIHDK